ncbi:hypothetical protein [Leifsonia sp. Leaf336]|uniref:hypothetical protein n=1 Tax=Leifsonia sp. Leaf336 TaxID=1736341 RepID=UPI0012FC318B|nr:hypothetical protein [Leifsonia sp. Leaf336]
MITAATAIIAALAQITLPVSLRRRERLLREFIDHEQVPHRKELLVELHGAVSARILGGLLVPGWRFIEPLWLMVAGAAQYLVWQRSASVWNLVLAVLISLVIVTTPARRIIRLSCERARVIHEYEIASSEIRRPRLGILSQMEGGTRVEFVYALFASAAINLVAIGSALAILNLPAVGLGIGILGLIGLIVIFRRIQMYVRRRVTVFGPWSTDDTSD